MVVVPDPHDAQPDEVRASAHRALDSAERLKTIEAIKEGLASIDRGEGRPMDEVFDDLEQSLGSQVRP